MAISTAAGTTLGISVAAPATFNAAGYEALTFVTIGEITDAGSHGRVYQVPTANVLAERSTRKVKGTYDEGTKSLQLLIDHEDAGQEMLREALDSDDVYTFAVGYPDGSFDYFQALVTSFQTQASSPDSFISGTVDLALTTDGDGGGILFVPAAP